MKETINDRITRAVREWPHWSPAERKRIDQITEEVLEHCRSGTGNTFIANWCRWHLDTKGNAK